MGTAKALLVAWPAFISACLLELVVFAFVDPLEVHWGGHTLGWSRQAVYTAGFFVFWLAGLVTGALTMLLVSAAPKTADCPMPPSERPPGCALR